MRRHVALTGLAALLLTALPAAPASAHTYTYTVETRGGVSSDVGTFSALARSALEDSRGWSLGGAVSFRQVRSGGDFRLTLATPAAVDAASPGCSPTWSCRVGNLVLINEERWNSGTASWTGGLHSYRHYVINHEVGHWLGLGHRACPAPGRRAPVMQQQSISLDGCTSNTWPLPSEKRALASAKGISWEDDGGGDSSPLLNRGDRGPAVAEWQRQLNQVRANDIRVDQIFGPVTQRATMDFQRSQGILVDGVVGPQTRQAMRSALSSGGAPEDRQSAPLLQRGDRGPAVAEWQRQLNQVRANDIRVDEIFGPVTQRATMDFQRSQGILVDGIVGPQTRQAMRNALR